MGAWFLGIIRGLFAAIDKVVVWLVESLYSLIFDIASVQIFTNKELGEFASRITVILTIFMLFKLSFSFLNYIINPDNMTDKGKGVSKLIQNIAVSLVLLVSYQFIFDKAMELQQKIIDNETIPKLIFGAGAGTKASEGAKNPGTLSFALFSSFVVPNTELPEGCAGYAFKDTPSTTCDLSSYTVDVTDYTDPKGNTIRADEPDAVNEQFNTIVKYKDTHALLGHMISWKEGEIYAFDYKFIISTACGVFAALVLLSFCFDVAIRTIKLAFLRLIAPIPIISYIDPNKGEGVFKKWLSTVGKTYADLFIRLIAIFFAIYIIQIITAKGSLVDLNNQPINNPFVVIFIILGALMFAKQFPKLIQDITGISLDSKMQLNPFKRIGEQAIGGKTAGKVIGATSGAVGGAIAGAKAGAQAGAFGRGLIMGTAGGFMQGFKNPKGAFGQSMNQQYKNLTGNEMSRLSLGNVIMSSGSHAKNAVQEPRDYTKKAYENLSALRTQLNSLEQNSANYATALQSSGIDIGQIDAVRDSAVANRGNLSARMNNASQSLENARDTVRRYQGQRQRIESSLNRSMEALNNLRPEYKTEFVYENGKTVLKDVETQDSIERRKRAERQVSTLQSLLSNCDSRIESVNLQSLQQQYDDANQAYSENENIIQSIDSYKNALKEESNLREQISKVELNIDTIKKEKAQRETFYRYDDSPKEKYNKAKADTDDMHRNLHGS